MSSAVIKAIVFFCAWSYVTVSNSGLAASVVVGCNPVPGVCQAGNFINELPSESIDTCLALCAENPQCSLYSYFIEEKSCLQFSECTQYYDGMCSNNDCYSGTPDCICSQSGQCEGNSINIQFLPDLNSCVQACYDNANCTWWNYDPVDTFCLQLSECTAINTVCPECLTGERDCYGQSNDDAQVLFVAGGFNGVDFETSVDVIPLDPSGLTCPAVPDSPIHLSFGSGFVHQGNPVVCGHIITNLIDSYCYLFNVTSWAWESFFALELRKGSAGVTFRDDWMISGGFKEPDTSRDTSDIFDNQSGVLIAGPQLPTPMELHCVSGFDDSQAIFTGGQTDSISTLANTYAFDYDTQTFDPLADLLTERSGHACGIVRPDSGDPFMVVAGGTGGSSAEIYNFGGDSWQSGIPLPEDIRFASSVAFGNSFLVVGGQKSAASTAFDTIWHYDASNSAQPWLLRSEKLTVARTEAPVSLILDAETMKCDDKSVIKAK